MRIRKNDNVVVISGKDRGKQGKVMRSFPKKERLLVEGVSMVKRHIRAGRQLRQAGIIERESPIHISDVMLLCTKCRRPTRVGFHFLEDGSKVRVCKKCGEVID